MIYFQIDEDPKGRFTVLDKHGLACSKAYEERGLARAEMYRLTGEYLRKESEEAYKFGAELDLELWTWHDKVMDGNSFVEEYRREK